MLILAISIYFHELLQNRGLAAVALLCESCRVVIVAINVPLMFVIAVRGAKDGRAHRTSEVLNVVFPVESGNVRASQCLPASIAQQIESSEVICFAKWVLARRLFGNWEELRGYDLAALL